MTNEHSFQLRDWFMSRIPRRLGEGDEGSSVRTPEPAVTAVYGPVRKVVRQGQRVIAYLYQCQCPRFSVSSIAPI